jgi:hypothetical protein
MEIDRELACLGREAPAGEHRRAIDDLITSWGRLTQLLAVGAGPEQHRPALD